MSSLPNDRSARQRRKATYAWLYPIKGILYLARNKYLHPLLRTRILPATLLSAFVLATLFTWTYLPQAALLYIFHGHGAWVNAAILVLGEGAAITALLFEAFLVDETQVDVFDAVLVAHGYDALVARSRPVEPAAPANMSTPETYVRDARARLGRPASRATYAPFSFRQIAEFILFLPLNLIPWIGVPLFLWVTGWRAGPLQHHRYFKLKEMDRREKRDFIRQRRLGYTGFGVTALVLQLVPVLSMVFLLTSAAGSALWVVRLEDEARREAGDVAVDATAPAPVEGEEPPPYTEYVDDPV